ncbi:MAG TPA: porphobilinogen synthase [Opitutales bacterium]|jgi:porphobilinogen synthase|nr:porphobilinogen synthase [Opitutales bacterium]
MPKAAPTASARLVLPQRPRRLRRTAAIRALVRETRLDPAQLIQPVFVHEGKELEPIPSLPGIARIPVSRLSAHCRELVKLGIGGIALFPKVDAKHKDDTAREALNSHSLVLRAVHEAKSAAPQFPIFADIALDPYTPHGHDGVLTKRGDDVDNDRTVAILAEMAVFHARAGVDFVAPSDMMDGRVGVIRRALDSAGHETTGIMAYSAKYASAYYGPFRDAVGSKRAASVAPISKATYQMDPANRREALREAALDEAEGADILMVKPALLYLDIIADLRAQSMLPIAAYQVSGEYAQICAASERGWLDLQAARDESLLAIRRAGADIILTYFAEAFAKGR